MTESTTAPGGSQEMDQLIEIMRRVHGLEVSRYDLSFSLAILLLELSEERERPVPFRIFATDNSEAQLALARTGVYTEAAMRNVRLGHLTRWFSRQGPAYLAAPALRERVDFSVHDLFSDRGASPPESIFGEFDLVLCCNVLFYYRPAGRQLILDKLQRGLAPGGYLVTGYPDSELMKQAARHAPVMLLAKPVENALLERTVRTVVGAKLASVRPANTHAMAFMSADNGGDR